MISTAEFLAQLERPGKLRAWQSHIFTLHQAGATYGQIAMFLRSNGIKADKAEVYRFIHRKKRQRLRERKPGAVSVPDNGPAATPRLTPAPPQGVLPKFDWRPQRDRDTSNW